MNLITILSLCFSWWQEKEISESLIFANFKNASLATQNDGCYAGSVLETRQINCPGQSVQSAETITQLMPC